jgi:D-3-phosphoglycerate dehydrogenase
MLRVRLQRAVTRGARFLRILAADPVDASCGETFADAGHKLVEKKMGHAELLASISAYEGLVVRSGVKVTADIIAAGKKLRIIGRAGAGVDNIDTAAATRHGILVMNTPGGNTSAAAELTMSLLMSLARQIPAACAALKDGKWERKAFSAGTELAGKTVGVVGLGMIGAEVARHCRALNMKTIAFDPVVSEDTAAAVGIKKATLDEIWAQSDFITVHTPLNDATKNLICAATLKKCKPGVFILNAARGGIINEADLLAALKSGHVRGAAIDVFESEPPTSPVTKELIANPAVVCTPHLGASTEEAQKKVAREIAAQMSDAFEGRAFVGVVNAPFVALSHKPAFAAYVKCAEALGAMQGQISFSAESLRVLGQPLKGTTVRVDVEGPALQEKGFAELALASVLKGMLPAIPRLEFEAAVNLINAPFVARDTGVTVDVRQSPASSMSAFANTIKVTVKNAEGERVAVGAVIEGAPRIVQLDHWSSFPTFAPAGHLLLWNNIDSPGQVSRVAQVLAVRALPKGNTVIPMAPPRRALY